MLIGCKMIRIGFIIDVSDAWIGGVNYYRNLLYALNKINDKSIEIYLFIPKGLNDNLKKEFRLYSNVIEVDFFSKYNLKRIIWKILKKITCSDFMIEMFLRKYKIDIFSHSGIVGLIKSKTINWIPDFQHKHLPGFFQKKDNMLRDIGFERLARKSNCVILSSNDAKKDFELYFKEYLSKVKILQFVSQPGEYINNNKTLFNELKVKYRIDDNYFIIPNHFWKHKNHLVVFESMVILKRRGINVNLICTGLLEDYRDPEYPEVIKSFIENNKINVKLLGVINYNDLILLIKNSISVINPSLFEGWSTIVEECKSLGKNIILSDISIHKEQDPQNSTYFDPHDPKRLADILQYNIDNTNKIKTLYDNIDFNINLDARTIKFGNTFQNIIKNVYNDRI
jgi:glycosyltransferase involved in cell wall biosynthesis